MTIQQIEYISEIAHHRSMNKAAQNLFVSQPTLSQSVKELEEELGIVIFDRSRKGVSLTSDGIEFLRMAKGMLEQLDQIKNHYSGCEQKGGAKRFQISSQHYMFVIDAFSKFMWEYEKLRYVFHVKETRTLAAIDDVYTQKSAMGVIFLNKSNETLIQQILEQRSVVFHPCIEVRPHVFLKADHQLADKKTIKTKDLEPYPMLVFEQEGEEHLAEEASTHETHQTVYVRDRASLVNLIGRTNGYNIGSGIIVPDLCPTDIRAIPLADTDDVMRIGWIHLSNKTPTAETRRFTELLQQTLETHHPDRRKEKNWVKRPML